MFSFLDPVLKWIGTFLGWLDNITGSYMLALFIFAILVELIMLPIGIKQQKNSIKQAKLRPKEMAIKKKYAGRDDKVTQQKMQTEIQELYQRENFNQLGGCLPALIQIPVILILYQIVINPLKFVVHLSDTAIASIQAYMSDVLGMASEVSRGSIELISKIRELGIDAFSGLDSASFAELSAAYNKGLPNFKAVGLDLGMIPSFKEPSWLLLIPVLTFVVYFASMKLTRKFTYQAPTAENAQAGCSNKIMDIVMPAMSVWITFIMPAAIGVYWIFKSMLGTLKQFAVNKLMPLPQFTEEDYKAAEREYMGKQPKKKPAAESGYITLPNGERKRSLHHIDDDDDYDTVYRGLPPKNKPEEEDDSSDDNEVEAESTPSVEEKSDKRDIIESAPMKTDDRNERKSDKKEKKNKKKKKDDDMFGE